MTQAIAIRTPAFAPPKARETQPEKAVFFDRLKRVMPLVYSAAGVIIWMRFCEYLLQHAFGGGS